MQHVEIELICFYIFFCYYFIFQLSHPILTACIRCYGSFLSDGGGECNIDATCDVMPTLIYAR